MKSTLYFAALLFLIPRLNCQDKPLKTNTNCTVETEARDLYLKDAKQLVFQHILDEEPPEKDEIEIPHADVERVLSYLAAVYNAIDSLPAANEVVNKYKVHDRPPYWMNHIMISVDVNYMWTRVLLAGNTPTGNPDADKLINAYNLEYYSSHKTKDEAVYLVSLKTDKLLNTEALSDAFEAVEGVVNAGPSPLMGGGSHIEMSGGSHIEMSGYGTDEVTLIYNLGWGDCPAGCHTRYYWTFTVDENCNVTYHGSYGRLPGRGYLFRNTKIDE